MKKKFLLQTLALLCIVLTFGFFSSCEEEVDTQVQLLSFGPSGVHHGDEIVFIGTNLNKVTSITLAPNVEITSFNEKTASRIKLTVPENAEAGKIVLKYNGGEIESKTILNFEVPVTVSGIAPSEAKPGTNITISGDKVNWIESVTFEKNVTVTKQDFVSQSLTELVVTVPFDAKTGFLIFNTGGTDPLTFGSEDPLTVTLPTVSGVSPTVIEQTQKLTISGTNLDLVTQIDFAGTNATVFSFVSQSETTIEVNVPNTAVTGAVVLTVGSGLKITAPSITVTEPVVTSMTTNRAGTENVTISGTNLNLVKSITFPVDQGGTATTIQSTSFVSLSASSIVVGIPASAIPGVLSVKTVYDFVFTVPNFKIVLPLATAYSSTTVNQPTVISGTDLDLVTSITFPGGTNVTSSSFTNQTASSITVNVPANATVAGTLIFKISNGYSIPQQLSFGGCTTSFPGTLLFEFKTSSQVTAWNLAGSAATSSNFSNTDGHSCNGMLTITTTITNAGTNFQYDIGAVDWTGKTKLHMWIKVEPTDVSTMNGAQVFAQPNWGWSSNGYWGQASTLFNGQWHEVVLNLSGDLTSMNRIGLQILTTAGNSQQATVSIDDVWVE